MVQRIRLRVCDVEYSLCMLVCLFIVHIVVIYTVNTGKVRRLYDVANILTSLGLISKKGFGGGTNFRKPGFYWSGPIVFPKSKGNVILYMI